jgi:hypothetical protein
MGIIFEVLFAHILVTQFYFLFQVSKFHPKCLKLQKNLRSFMSSIKKEDKYIDSTQNGKMSKFDFLIEFFAFKHTNLL